MTVESFGPQAGRYAARLQGLSAVVADVSAPAQALAAAVRRRRSGEPFLAAVLLDDVRSHIAYEIAPQLLAAQTDDDGRRALFDALGVEALTVDGKAQKELAVLPEPVSRALADVAMTAHGALVRSREEARRLATLLGRQRDLTVVLPAADETVPACPARSGADALVVWAAGLPARQTAIYAYALADFFVPVLIACDERPAFSTKHVQYVAPDAHALARAAAIVDASISGPDAALALAACGAGMAVTVPSGAAEFLEGVASFAPWSWREIQAAAQRALGLTAPRRAAGIPTVGDAAAALERADGDLLRDGPLVSVVVPTYNRRDLLPRALDSLRRQRYRNVEIVVVNDGGTAVDDLVGAHPNAVLLENERNLGITESTNRAFRAARGTYVTFCCDDDMLFPDAIARWVTALERSKAKVVHGNTIMRFDRRIDGRVETVAYKMPWRDNVDHVDSIYTPFTPLSCVLLHREVLDRLGYYLDTPAADTELIIRISRAYDFVHVDQPCAELEYDPWKGQGPVSGFSRRADALAEVFALYPTPSARIQRERSERLAWHRARGEAGAYFEPDVSLANPQAAPGVWPDALAP